MKLLEQVARRKVGLHYSWLVVGLRSTVRHKQKMAKLGFSYVPTGVKSGVFTTEDAKGVAVFSRDFGLSVESDGTHAALGVGRCALPPIPDPGFRMLPPLMDDESEIPDCRRVSGSFRRS